MHALAGGLPSWVVGLIGYVAAACTTISFLPQLIRVYRLKSAHEISLTMFLVYSFGVSLWLVYGIFIGSLPVIVSNVFSVVLSSAILALKVLYDRRRRTASAKIEQA